MDKKNAQPLVSIVTPCYNGAKSVKTFLDSVLHQTYDNIEIFFINDGSTDKTEDICKEYAERFKERGYDFYYIKQENAGQAAAINKGLKLFKGKYLTWPDSDDYLCPEYVEHKVNFLESHPEYNMVISPITHVHESDLSKGFFTEIRTRSKNDNLFTDFIQGRNSYYPPGGYMITAEGFLKAYPNRQILESKEGQNIQMLLPMAYMHKYGHLDEVLYHYIIYSNSHAHKERQFQEALDRSDSIMGLMQKVMAEIDMPKNEREQYEKMLEHERWRRHFYFSIQYKNRKYMNEVYKKHRKTGSVLLKDCILHIVRNFTWK